MPQKTKLKVISAILTAVAPLLLSGIAFAADADGTGQINNFLTNIIQILSGIAFLIAVGFIVIGGLHYITSSGNPEHLDKAKRTIGYAALGLIITIAAFSITNIVGNSAGKAFGK